MDWPYQLQIVLWHIFAASLAMKRPRPKKTLLILLLSLAIFNVIGFFAMGSSIWYQGISLAALSLTLMYSFMIKKPVNTNLARKRQNALIEATMSETKPPIFHQNNMN